MDFDKIFTRFLILIMAAVGLYAINLTVSVYGLIRQLITIGG